MKKDSLTTSSRNLWTVGLFLKEFEPCIHREVGGRPFSAPRGEGAMLVTAVGGVGSDRVLQGLQRTRDSFLSGGLTVDGHASCAFTFPCQSSLQPQRGQRRSGEVRDAPGPGRIITLVTVPHTHITCLPARAFSLEPAL